MWYSEKGSVKMGRLSQSNLAYCIRKGQVDPDEMVKGPGLAEWTNLSEVQERILVPYDGPAASDPYKGSTATCLLVGLFAIGVGCNYLFIVPGNAGATYGGQMIVNYQRLAIGMASSIVGAIFMAAALRPR